jgi:5'-3' exonuclease
VLNVEILKKCCAALESYIMSDVENICAMYAGKEWLLGIETYMFPKSDNYYESDRLCAKVAYPSNSNSPAVLSEDLDCVVLFGAEFMIKEVFEQFISYVSLKDIMNTFGVKDRKDMVHRCCIMGTHFNLGLKGVGPVKIKQLNAAKAAELFKTCIKHQHIDQNDFYKFFNL